MPSEDTQFKKGNKFCGFTKGCKHSEETKKRMSFIKKGVNNPAWKGGISPLEAKIRRSFEYRQWRSDVFTRDNFACQECCNNRDLEAHHIKSFALIIHENNIKTIEQAKVCEELWNINNGVTFCVNCHKTKK
jgi:hypothetical protein